MNRKKKANDNKRIWITWETQTRNKSLSSEMSAKLFEKDPKLNAFIRYIYLTTWTAILLIRNKAKIVFVQNPSLILAFISVFIGRIILKKNVIVDAHNIALEPIIGFWRILERIRRFTIKHATFTIVSNEELTSRVTKFGGTPLVLPDPFPDIRISNSHKKLQGKKNAMYICTWANDEPYCEVVKAASLLDDSIVIYITGNHKGMVNKCLSGLQFPENLKLTGYLSKEDYDSLITSVDLIIDLTTRDSCLLCGAYEAVSAGKPMVLTNTNALKSYFYKGAVYTDNSYIDIANKIDTVLKQNRYQKEVIKLKEEVSSTWRKRKDNINNIINSLT